MMTRPHTSIMVEEMLEYFQDVQIRTFFDGTLGAGGHSRAILEAHPEIKLLIGCDRDPSALSLARQHLLPWEEKIAFVHGNFVDLDCMLASLGVKEVDGFFLT